jgi:hypothetical protein
MKGARHRRCSAMSVRPLLDGAIPDDTHHWMRFANQMRVNAATAEFFERKLKPTAAAPGAAK